MNPMKTEELLPVVPDPSGLESVTHNGRVYMRGKTPPDQTLPQFTGNDYSNWNPGSIAEQVSAIETVYCEAMSLLGEIVATVTLPANRETFIMNALLAEFDRWEARYKQLTGGK